MKKIHYCEHCGQKIRKPIEHRVTTNLVSRLLAIYKFCLEKQRHEFKREEFNHLFGKGESSFANFGYWKWFGAGLVYTPEGRGKGYWGFNLQRIAEFFAGKRQVYAVAWKEYDPNEGAEVMKYKDLIFIKEVPHVFQFLDSERNFIISYVEPMANPEPQRSLF